MKKTKLIITLMITLLFATIGNAQMNFKTIRKEFGKLSGVWEGTLTYLDYSSGKPHIIPADLKIIRINTSKFIFSNVYPKEPRENSTDTLFISADYKYIDKGIIKSTRKLTNGDIQIITEELGKDGNDNKPAIFRHIYTFSSATFTKRKDVQFIGEAKWINRNEYSYKKKFSR